MSCFAEGSKADRFSEIDKGSHYHISLIDEPKGTGPIAGSIGNSVTCGFAFESNRDLHITSYLGGCPDRFDIFFHPVCTLKFFKKAFKESMAGNV